MFKLCRAEGLLVRAGERFLHYSAFRPTIAALFVL